MVNHTCVLLLLLHRGDTKGLRRRLVVKLLNMLELLRWQTLGHSLGREASGHRLNLRWCGGNGCRHLGLGVLLGARHD